MKEIKLNKKEIEWILWEIDGLCESHTKLEDHPFTFRSEDYDDIKQSELNTMEGLKNKLEKSEGE